jgi:hypothetical protein
MTATAYIDESIRAGHYHLCAVLVPSSRSAAVTRIVRQLAHPHPHIHMQKRNDRERLEYVREVARMRLTAYVTAERGSARPSRDAALRLLTSHLLRTDVAAMTVESCGQDAADRRILRDILGANAAMRYEFRDKSELLLSLPDVVAWAHPRGRKWRDALGDTVTVLR